MDRDRDEFAGRKGGGGAARRHAPISTPGVDPATAAIVGEFACAVGTSESLDECFGHLARAVESLGFGAITYTAIPLTLSAAGQISPSFLVSEGFSAGFLAHYEQAGFASRDFTIERVRAGRVEVMDWCREREHGGLRAEQREVIDVARFDYGIRNALSIPTRSDAHVIAGASVVCDERADRFLKLKEERLVALQAIVRMFHRHAFAAPAMRRHFYSGLLDRLTGDEIKVIRLVIGGHRLKCSADLCGMSPTRAGNLLSSLYRKLGVSNASELAYLMGVHRVDRLL